MKTSKIILHEFFPSRKHEISVFLWELDTFAADRIMLKNNNKENKYLTFLKFNQVGIIETLSNDFVVSFC